MMDKNDFLLRKDILAQAEIFTFQLDRVNKCFLNFSSDPLANINQLTKLCGELMGADCALYNRLEEGLLCAWGKWQIPKDFNARDNPEGHICCDVIQNAKDKIMVIRDLPETKYAWTDPNVELYHLKTYIGKAVKLGDNYVGSLCAVFKRDFIPQENDKKMMELIAAAIGIEDERYDSKKRLKESEKHFKSMVEQMPSIVTYTAALDKDSTTLYVSPQIENILGVSVSDYKKNPNFWKEHVHPDDRQRVMLELEESHKSGKPFVSEYRMVSEQGKTVWFRDEAAIIKNDKNEPIYLQGLMYDITDRKCIEEALQKGEKFLSSIFASIQDGVSVLDLDMTIIQVNPTMEKWYPFSMPLTGKKCYQAYQLHDKECEVCPVVNTIKTGKAAYEIIPKIDKTGKTIGWFDLYSFPLVDLDSGQLKGVIEYIRDITERKRAEEVSEELNIELMDANKKLRQLALKDAHTGLYNHRYLTDIIESEFHRAKRYGSSLSVIMLDLDYFKSINDVYGHHFGDKVLKQLAQIFKKTIRKYDIVTRFGGEEFVFVLPDTDRQGALILANRIRERINLHNFGTEKQVVHIKASLGVVTYPQDKVIYGIDLIKLVDDLLSKVKDLGGNNVYSAADFGNAKLSPAAEIKVRGPENVKTMKEKITRLTKRANRSLMEAIFAFARTIELKDHYTGEHVEKTVHYAVEMARVLDLSTDDIENIRDAAMLHDLGKIGISEKILLKKGKLTQKEFEEIKKHPHIGADIIRPIHFMHKIIPLILYHHERYDGKGYLGGLKGEEIPVGARIIAVADVYQALTSNRPYRNAYPKLEAIEMVKNGAGSQFDPQIIKAFLEVIKKESRHVTGAVTT